MKSLWLYPRALYGKLFGAVLVAGVLVAAASGGEQAQEEPEETCPICDLKERVNSAIPGVSFGADFRFRLTYDNNLRLDKDAIGHERFWSRYRGRVWTKITPFENFDVNLRIVTEPRIYCKPESMEDQTIRQEVIFDKLNIAWSEVLGLPLTLKIGRQDIKLADGWLVIEGTPRDGTRTFFFDAVRATWDAKDIKTTFDLIAIRNHANSSWFIRPFNDRDLDLIEHDETGAIFYASNKSLENTTLDGYFIYKRDDRTANNGNHSDIYTFGARGAGTVGEHWKYRLQGAPQWGHKNGVNICAFGADSELAYHLNDKHNNAFRVGYEFRSGRSDQNGAFDILWGRYPHWSNIFNDYLSGLETLVSGPSNYHRVSFGWGCDLIEKLSLAANYHLVFAHQNPFSGATGFSSDGKFRGQVLTGRLKYAFNEHVSGHLTGEFFCPGNYYDDARNDPALFLRYEIMLSW